MNTLDPIKIPLNQASLIEASAGTGKTYTMANLYLRLVLGIDCEPMMVEQILVVTFTKAATQELRDRIRLKLAEITKVFTEPTSEYAQKAFENDPFIKQLYDRISENRSEALLRLRIAEREMDLASIFTIDSFCQKMLFQYAFDSGVRFDLDLQTDERELLKQLSEQTWRELFYPATLLESRLAAEQLHNPEKALEKVEGYLSNSLPELSDTQQQWLEEDYLEQAVKLDAFLAKTRAYWRENYLAIIEPIEQAFERQNSEKVKILNGTSYKEKSFKSKWLPELNQWSESNDWAFPEKLLSYFSQSMLSSKASKGAEVLTSPYFEQWDLFLSEYEGIRKISSQIEVKLLYRYFKHLRQKLIEYKNSHIEKNFNDILNEFHQALTSENGLVLAEKIRQQFLFAMIDEAQDTNQIQYEIFQRIFIEGVNSHGFIMIGDPKQSIYKFRGADIFAYFTASKLVADTFTLSKNWRSLPKLVETVNQLFEMPANYPPFLYPEIQFSPVQSNETTTALLNGEQETNLYLLSSGYDTAKAAEHCAAQIQRSLTQAEQGILFVKEKAGEGYAERRLQPKDIAILVRSHSEAEAVKRSLAVRNIQSVFLSERKSVFASQEAKDLVLILQACLTPFSQRAVLSALGSALWGWGAEAIYQLKNSENQWEYCVEQFLAYQHIWQMQGVLPMLHQLIIEQNIVARLNGRIDSDRRLTNILHLAELLQEKMETVENESALLRWLIQQIEKPSHNDEQILRLESEEALVKIVTIHKSKGLEYPVIWLPFIGKNSKGASVEPMTIYRDSQNVIRWDFNSGDEELKRWLDNSEYAEDLRLLYVALTRAKYQLHLVLPEKWGDKWNAMHYLLSNGEISKNALTSDYFDQKRIEYRAVILPEEADQEVFEYQANADVEVKAKEFTGKIREIGQITSFTALQAQNDRLQNSDHITPLAGLRDDSQDYDQIVVAEHFLALQERDDFTPYQFPHSTKVGNILHRFLELLDFSSPLDPSAIQTLCEQLDLSDEWYQPVAQWFERILDTTFGHQPFCLAQITNDKRLNEWQFYLRLSDPKALIKINSVLKQHSRLAKQLPDLQFFQFEGFVRGFVDCIVEVDRRFYIIDYKSNFLGYLAQDYSATKLEKTMGQYRYDLQYLLYTLAVHRYLRSRLGEKYDYERDFGGVAYLFLRGMDGSPQSGVYFDKPSAVLIDELDRLFD